MVLPSNDCRFDAAKSGAQENFAQQKPGKDRLNDSERELGAKCVQNREIPYDGANDHSRT